MLLGFAPCLSIILYSKLPLAVRVVVLIFYLGGHILWALRFVGFYQKVEEDPIRANNTGSPSYSFA